MIEKRFLFNGRAVPFGGRITRIDPARDLNYCVDDMASSALPVVGGCSLGRGEAFELVADEPRRVRLFSAREYGSESKGERAADGTYHTSVQTFVKGVEIIERITVDSLGAALTSTHGPVDRYASIRPEAGTDIQGFRLDGVEVKVELDLEPFRKYATRQGYKRAARATSKGGLVPEARGIVFGTIVRKMTFEGPPPEGATIRSNVIYWKNVGRIYVGEILITDHSRHLTMLRVQLGSPIEGSFALGDVESNGTGVP